MEKTESLYGERNAWQYIKYVLRPALAHRIRSIARWGEWQEKQREIRAKHFLPPTEDHRDWEEESERISYERMVAHFERDPF